jgi:hypothetical protein
MKSEFRMALQWPNGGKKQRIVISESFASAIE